MDFSQYFSKYHRHYAPPAPTFILILITWTTRKWPINISLSSRLFFLQVILHWIVLFILLKYKTNPFIHHLKYLMGYFTTKYSLCALYIILINSSFMSSLCLLLQCFLPTLSLNLSHFLICVTFQRQHAAFCSLLFPLCLLGLRFLLQLMCSFNGAPSPGKVSTYLFLLVEDVSFQN